MQNAFCSLILHSRIILVIFFFILCLFFMQGHGACSLSGAALCVYYAVCSGWVSPPSMFLRPLSMGTSTWEMDL